MNSLAVLAVLAVATVQALPQATVSAQSGAAAAAPQIQSNLPGLFLPSPLVQFQSPPFLAQVPGAAGQPASLQHVIPLTSFVPLQVRPLTDAEQNALAHQEFQRIWEAQATRNLAIPQLQAAVAAKVPNAAGQTSASAPAPASAAPSVAPVSNNVF